MHQILTRNQRESISKILSLCPKKELVMNITKFEGYLFGIAITPDLILPSEWLPVVFGGQEPAFKSQKEAYFYFDILIDAYNKYSNAFTNNLLEFPFDIDESGEISEEILNQIKYWTHGFILAISHRDKIWFVDYYAKGLEGASYACNELILGFLALIKLAKPEEFDEVSKNVKLPKEMLDEFEIKKILRLLPYIIYRFVNYGKILWKEQVEAMRKYEPDITEKKEKVGRNDPCPCGSGKKYKWCCGKE